MSTTPVDKASSQKGIIIGITVTLIVITIVYVVVIFVLINGQSSIFAPYKANAPPVSFKPLGEIVTFTADQKAERDAAIKKALGI